MADPGAPSGTPDEQADPRVAELRRLWQERPTPRAGLQLAEELRRGSRVEESQEVLERSLEENPGHLSTLVALGKTRLELADAAGAVSDFEQVVDRDPTHLVANKLLIEAYLLQGKPEQAGSRLEHYRLLNGGDSEIESLAVRVAELAEEQAEATAEPPPRSATAEPAVRREVDAGGGDPFPQLGIGDRRRYLDGLEVSGIFPLPDPSPVPEPGPVPDRGPAPERPELAEPAAVEPTAAEPPAAEPAAIEPATTPAAEIRAAEAITDPELPRSDRARVTSTLGELYLAQGHLRDAEGVFRQVLTASPGDRAAAVGLAEVLRRRQSGLSAQALLRWAEESGEVGEGEGEGEERSDRRAALLTAYRARLRSRAGSERAAQQEETTDVP